ncbi:hypothetical protein X975_22140, partial [Stegodyphus mimosarum]
MKHSLCKLQIVCMKRRDRIKRMQLLIGSPPNTLKVLDMKLVRTSGLASYTASFEFQLMLVDRSGRVEYPRTKQKKKNPQLRFAFHPILVESIGGRINFA